MPKFMGKELPTLSEGKAYALRIYPGGRMQIVQTEPQNIEYAYDAAKKLSEGKRVDVWLDDAVLVLKQTGQSVTL